MAVTITFTPGVGWTITETGGGTGPLAKLDATAAPDGDNDETEGYSEGSIWVDVSNDKSYLCVDASEGEAVWNDISQTAAGGTTDLGNTPAPTLITITSSTGDNTDLPAADVTNAGLLLPAEKVKLGAIDISGGSEGDVLTVQADGSLAVETPAGGGGGLTVLADHATTDALVLTANSVISATDEPSSTTLPASGSDTQVEFKNRSGAGLDVSRAGADTINVDGSTGQTTVAVPDNSTALFHIDSASTEWHVQILDAAGEANTISSAGTGTSVVASTSKVGGDLQVRGLASPGGTVTITQDDPNENVDLAVASVPESAVTAHEEAIDHNALTNFVAAEHIDWTADAGASNINVANITAVPESAVTAHEAALTVSRTNVPAVDSNASRTMVIANDLGTKQEGFIRLSHATAQYNAVKNIASVGQRFMVQWTNASPTQAAPFTASGGGVTFVPSSLPAIDTQYQTLCLLCVDATTDANVFQILPASL